MGHSHPSSRFLSPLAPPSFLFTGRTPSRDLHLVSSSRPLPSLHPSSLSYLASYESTVTLAGPFLAIVLRPLSPTSQRPHCRTQPPTLPSSTYDGNRPSSLPRKCPRPAPPVAGYGVHVTHPWSFQEKVTEVEESLPPTFRSSCHTPLSATPESPSLPRSTNDPLLSDPSGPSRRLGRRNDDFGSRP